MKRDKEDRAFCETLKSLVSFSVAANSGKKKKCNIHNSDSFIYVGIDSLVYSFSSQQSYLNEKILDIQIYQ
jgi:hypothetical protein